MHGDSCQCEHIAHFDSTKLTPRGNSGHSYSEEFPELKAVHTSYGTFHVCSACRNDCWEGVGLTLSEYKGRSHE